MKIKLDKRFCRRHGVKISDFYGDFEKYLFNKMEEDYIITHYYRSMLIRMRFEHHTSASIIILLLGSLMRICVEKDFKIARINYGWFVLISLSILLYLVFGAKKGV